MLLWHGDWHNYISPCWFSTIGFIVSVFVSKWSSGIMIGIYTALLIIRHIQLECQSGCAASIRIWRWCWTGIVIIGIMDIVICVVGYIDIVICVVGFIDSVICAPGFTFRCPRSRPAGIGIIIPAGNGILSWLGWTDDVQHNYKEPLEEVQDDKDDMGHQAAIVDGNEVSTDASETKQTKDAWIIPPSSECLSCKIFILTDDILTGCILNDGIHFGETIPDQHEDYDVNENNDSGWNDEATNKRPIP